VIVIVHEMKNVMGDIYVVSREARDMGYGVLFEFLYPTLPATPSLGA
jgi:hypothetical protein